MTHVPVTSTFVVCRGIVSSRTDDRNNGLRAVSKIPKHLILRLVGTEESRVRQMIRTAQHDVFEMSSRRAINL